MSERPVALLIEDIGEAASRLPHSFREAHPEIEWAKIVGLRHRIVHEYFGVDLRIIWHIIQEDLPSLTQALRNLRQVLKPKL